MAHLRKKANSPYWQATFKNADGRFVERSTKCENRKDAEAWAAEMEKASRRALAGELTKAQAMRTLDEMVFHSTGEETKRETLREFFERWLGSKIAQGKHTTVSRYRPVINGFLEFIGERRANAIVGAIVSRDIESFRNKQLEDGKSPSTADFHLKVLRAAFETARKQSLTLKNPTDGVEILAQAAEEREPFTDEQVRDLLKVADDEWKGMILFAYHTGIRLHDSANLVWESVDMGKGVLSFLPSKTARKRAKSDRRGWVAVALHPEVVGWLKSRPEGIGNAPIFPSLHGKPTGSHGGLSNAFASVMSKAEIAVPLGVEKDEKGKGRRFRRLSFHSLRHTFISRLANAGVSADVRKEMAGHSSDQMHARYTHLDVATQKAAIEKLSAVGGGV